MTVESTVSRVQYSTNGTTGPFSVPFYFINDEDLEVTYANTSGTETVLTLSADYAVTGEGDPAGGSVTTTTAYAAGGTITIRRVPSLLQETDYTDTDRFPAVAHERALDRAMMAAQYLKEELSRAIRFPVSFSGDPTIPVGADSVLLGLDSTGSLTTYERTSGDTAAASGLTFLQVGTGAVGRTVESKLRDVVSVKDCGAVGDGATDDTAAINVAISIAQALVASRFMNGVTVFFPRGAYKITSTLLITSSNVTLAGESPSSAMLYAPSANFDLVHFDGSSLALYSVGVRNLRIYTPGNTTAGCHIRARRCINSMFDSVQCIGWYDGIISDGCAKTYYNNIILSQQNRTNGTTLRYAFDFASTAENNSDVHVSNYQINYDDVNHTASYTMSIRGADGIYFTNGHQFGGTLLQPSSTTCASIFWSNIYFDTSSVSNVRFDGTSADYRTFKFSNCYLRNSGGSAIQFNASSTVSRVNLGACTFATHRLYGVDCATTVDDLVINNGLFISCNTDNTAGVGDIRVSGKATIMGGRHIGGGAAGTAINLNASSSYCVVDGNSLVDSTAGTKISNSGTLNRIRGNPGFATKSSGQATLTNPATTVVVNHGLAVTPSIGHIRLTFNDASAGVTRMWPSTITATQFTINVNATPTTSAAIGWAVDTEA